MDWFCDDGQCRKREHKYSSYDSSEKYQILRTNTRIKTRYCIIQFLLLYMKGSEHVTYKILVKSAILS